MEKIQEASFHAFDRVNRKTLSRFHLIIMLHSLDRIFSRILQLNGENSLELSEYSSICEPRLRNLLLSDPNFLSILRTVAQRRREILAKSASDIEFEK